jgi:hypothetical protein
MSSLEDKNACIQTGEETIGWPARAQPLRSAVRPGAVPESLLTNTEIRPNYGFSS